MSTHTSAIQITEQDVQKVAHLSRLRLQPHEAGLHAKNLTNILDMITKINTIDTEQVLPMASPFGEVHLPLREDKVTASVERKLLQTLAPQVENGLYLVPQVIE